MTKFFGIFVALLSLACVHGFAIQPKIVNGIISNPSDFKYFAAIRTSSSMCSGVLISDKYVWLSIDFGGFSGCFVEFCGSFIQFFGSFARLFLEILLSFLELVQFSKSFLQFSGIRSVLWVFRWVSCKFRSASQKMTVFESISYKMQHQTAKSVHFIFIQPL